MNRISRITEVLLVSVILFLISTLSRTVEAKTWIELAPTGTPPAPRGFHGTTAVLDPSTNRMIVFGGMSSTFGSPFNDVWVLTNANGLGGTPQWINLIPDGAPGSPPSRAGHSAVYDPTTNRMIIFGGCHGGCFPILNDVWVLTNANGLGGTPAWIQLSPTGGPPSGRQSHRAVYHPETNRMIIFGGQNGSGNAGATFPEVWVLTNANGLGGTSTWIQLAPTGGPPPGQYAPSAVYDPASNRMAVFGGTAQGIGTLTNAVWVLSNANGLGGAPVWTNLIAEGAAGSPPARDAHSAVYNTASNQMTIFGAGPAGYGNDVWVLTNANGLGGTSAWTQLAPTGRPPTPRRFHGSVYDSATNRMTIFAGDGNAGVLLNDTWVLTEVPTLTLTLTGCISCRTGDQFTVQAHVTNLGFRNVSVEAKIGVRLPNGTPINLLEDKHLEVPLSAGLDTTFPLFDFPLPDGLPTGTWSLEGTLLGPELGETFSRDVKAFDVVP